MSITIEPIGFFRSSAVRKYEVPRQGVMNRGAPGVVELVPGKGFEQALRDVEGFERIWLLFHFHLNAEWNQVVKPPVPPEDHDKVGVFASRSPYRPNAIGLSCVKLLNVDGLLLDVDEADLLDGTPIFDIKPYIPKADAFPDACAGWTEAQRCASFAVAESGTFRKQNRFVLENNGPDLFATASVQLRENPFDNSQKRVTVTGENRGILAVRMFRIAFRAEGESIVLESVSSGYSAAELSAPDDPHGDKLLHKNFVTYMER